jgi:hypothetical protein
MVNFSFQNSFSFLFFFPNAFEGLVIGFLVDKFAGIRVPFGPAIVLGVIRL